MSARAGVPSKGLMRVEGCAPNTARSRGWQVGGWAGWRLAVIRRLQFFSAWTSGLIVCPHNVAAGLSLRQVIQDGRAEAVMSYTTQLWKSHAVTSTLSQWSRDSVWDRGLHRG